MATKTTTHLGPTVRYRHRMVVGARSFVRGQVEREELRAAAARCRGARMRERLREALDDLDPAEGDVQIVDGDLHVPGDLDLHERHLRLLLVTGRLVVEGALTDSDDPASFLIVGGAVTARDMVTSGWLDVGGDLEVAGSLVGDYDDGEAQIAGDVRTFFFYPEEHRFEVSGGFRAEVAVGNQLRLVTARKPRFISLGDPRIAEVFDHALLRFHDDEDEDGNRIEVVDGLRDFREFKRRIKAGEPLGRADT
jgi:hypothetical protein